MRFVFLLVTHALVIIYLVRYGHSAEVFGGDRMIVFGGIGDGSAYRDDLWFLYFGNALSPLLRK